MSITPAPQALAPPGWSFESAADCVRRADWEGARQAYGALALEHPSHAEVRCNLGLIEQLLDHSPAALVHFNEAARLQPEAARPYLLRADLHKACGRYEAALSDYDTALLRQSPVSASVAAGPAQDSTSAPYSSRLSSDMRADPDAQAHLHANRGTTLHALGRHAEALESFDTALECAAHTPGLHYNRGNALRELGRHEEAITSFDAALVHDGTDHQAHFNRGLCLGALGRWEAALDEADAVIAACPDHARAYTARGDWLKNLGRKAEALQAYDRALDLDDQAPHTHLNRGNTLREMGRAEEALQAYAQATMLDPSDWEAHYNRGIALHDLRRIPQALQSYGLARRLAPAEHRIEWNESLALLMSQRWHEGWLAYESRWRLETPDPALIQQAGQRWDVRHTLHALKAQRILLVAEQGLGDSLQFCRYVPLVMNLGAEVTLLVPESLRPLLESIAPGLRVVTRLTPQDRFDFHCPLMSLPLVLQRFDPRQGGHQPYLQADPQLVEQRSTAHPRSARLRVGLAWSGNRANPSDAHRSMALQPLLQAVPAGIDLVVLQGDIREADEAALAGAQGLTHDRQGLEGFAGTAAWCELVDVVLTVDTSIAHLAGALGRPTWVMLHQMADWRWLMDRDDPPWYPRTRLFRQSRSGCWDDVLDRVNFALVHAKQTHRGPTVG
ncbi:MAG: tetratricopeptide repeat protein [Limnohabitans sp.]|nr:tetratricopeptide repeat protein [Limnohabitans sp.]